MKALFVDFVLFVVGFARMSNKIKIMLDDKPLGPMPKGFYQAQVIGMIGCPVIAWCIWGDAFVCIIGFMAGTLYPIVWVHINWLTFSWRKGRI